MKDAMRQTHPLRLLPIVAATFGAIFAAPAMAACGIANDPVAIGFGPYTPITFAGKVVSGHVDSDATVSVSCTELTQAVTYALKLDGGSASSINARAMARSGGGSAMAYNLYVDASRTTVWGDGNNGSTFGASLSATDTSRSHTFYGRIPAGQSSVMPGSYSDILVITLEYNP